jgi:virginiamycin B lyase
MWVGDQSNIFRVTPRGSVTTFPLPAPYTAFDLVKGPDGNVWFTSDLMLDGSHYDAIGRMTPRGRLRFFTIPTANSAPEGIALGPDHDLWFGEGAGRIGAISTAGKIREFATGYRGSEISAILAGPGRSMWFMDRGRRAVGEITMSGVVREFAVPAPRRDTDLFTLAVGPRTSLWFTVSSKLMIGRLSLGWG